MLVGGVFNAHIPHIMASGIIMCRCGCGHVCICTCTGSHILFQVKLICQYILLMICSAKW